MKKVLLVLALGVFTLSCECKCNCKEEKSEKDEEKVELTSEDVMKEYCECIKKAGEDMEAFKKCADEATEAAKDVKDWKAPKGDPCKEYG